MAERARRDDAPGSRFPAAERHRGRDAITVRERLSETEASLVLGLVAAAARQDGVAPLSEHVTLHLRYGGDLRARNLLLYDNADLAGYAHLDPTDPVEGPSGELVIHPRFRRRGRFCPHPVVVADGPFAAGSNRPAGLPRRRHRAHL